MRLVAGRKTDFLAAFARLARFGSQQPRLFKNGHTGRHGGLGKVQPLRDLVDIETVGLVQQLQYLHTNQRRRRLQNIEFFFSVNK